MLVSLGNEALLLTVISKKFPDNLDSYLSCKYPNIINLS
nr:MAG TPA: hypothetical protein [Bacteriophage sp.]